MSQIIDNPLFRAQREKAGAETFDKYDYQYHWALYRVLSDHQEYREYAIFMEFHEDVVIADSLNPLIATFEFNQVKTTDKKYTTHQLTYRKKKREGLEPSVLGKLILSTYFKGFKDKISSVNLVASNGFNIGLKDPTLRLNKITLEEISDDEHKCLAEEILKELGLSPLPANIQFIIPNFPEIKYDDVVIGVISKLVSSIHPHSQTSSYEIYTSLIDELRKKGKVIYDFKNWNDLLKNKALTSSTVSNVISNFTAIKDESRIDIEFMEICSELGLKTRLRNKLRQYFNRYRQNRISNSSTNQIDIKNQILSVLTVADLEVENDNFEELLNSTIIHIPLNIKDLFSEELELKAAIICEYIMIN